MVFGGPLLKKKIKSSTKLSISPQLIIDALDPILRTLNYIKPNETVTDITFHTKEGKLLPITIKKEVLNFNAPSEPSKRE